MGRRGAYAIGICVMTFDCRVRPHGVEPVRRAINGAIPPAGKRHHLDFELNEAMAMEHSDLSLEQADRFGAHRLATRG
jgi:hypothetical protein